MAVPALGCSCRARHHPGVFQARVSPRTARCWRKQAKRAMGRAAGGGDDPTEDSEASKNKPSEEPREGREGRSEKPSPYDKFAEGVRIAKLRNVAAGRLRRRSSMRGAMDLAVSLRGEPRGKEDGERNGQGKTKEEKLKEDVSGAVATTAFAVAAGATLLRVGGRAALLSVAGLDFMQDSGLKDQVDQALAYADELGPWKLVAFAGAWCITKVACLDAIGVVLAVSSGILFGGVWQGGLASASCATLGSTIAFCLGRTVLKDRVAPEVEKRAALRAMERAVSNDGFKTVLTLRLAPLLPIPIGMYSYVYGASTSLAIPEFVAGTLVASLKPYTLDAYLGVFAKSAIDGDPGDNDVVILATFAAVILIGTLASQIATRTWEEVQAELALEEALEGRGAKAEDDGFAWMGLLGQKAGEDGPRMWASSAWGRLWQALDLEHAAATHKLPPTPDVPADWATRDPPEDLRRMSKEEAEELYNAYLVESAVSWLVTLQGIWKYSSKEAPLPSMELSLAAARRAVEEQKSGRTGY